MINPNSVPKPAIFLHIQKTAGSSIVDLSRLAYGSDQVVSHGDYLKDSPKLTLAMVDDIIINNISLPPFKEGAIRYQHLSFISGHFGFDFVKPLLNDRFSFTFLRDPVERILSYYYFCRARNPKEFEIYSLAHELSLDEFLLLGLERPSIKSCIWNNQTWQIADGYGNSGGRNVCSADPNEILALAIQNLNEFSYVGFAETFEADRDNILKALGILPPKEKIVSNATLGRPVAMDLPSSTLELLYELTNLDRILYKKALLKKEGNCAI